jgi:hypothetical protein
VREALLEMDPRSVLHNWGRVECFRRNLLTEHGAVTHELLDAEPQVFSVHYLRGVLVSAGLLNERAGSSWSGYGPSRPREVNQGPVI